MTTNSQSDSVVLEKQKAGSKPARPPKFKVLLLNDDYTPFEFVIDVLENIFSKSSDEAEALAVKIHHDGKGLCGTYIKDIAELKQTKVMQAARQDGHPLQCVLAPDAPEPSTGKSMRP
jgi:ATP-dependent Clp protease adaptor protein ClpS